MEVEHDGSVTCHEEWETAHMLLMGVDPSRIRPVHPASDLIQMDGGSSFLKGRPGEVVIDQRRLVDVDGTLEEMFGTDLNSYFVEVARGMGFDQAKMERAEARIGNELAEVRKRDAGHVLVVAKTIVDRMRARGMVWGVGRGSSCASFLLFLLGLHSVDCVEYDVPMSEFFKSKKD